MPENKIKSIKPNYFSTPFEISKMNKIKIIRKIYISISLMLVILFIINLPIGEPPLPNHNSDVVNGIYDGMEKAGWCNSRSDCQKDGRLYHGSNREKYHYIIARSPKEFRWMIAESAYQVKVDIGINDEIVIRFFDKEYGSISEIEKNFSGDVIRL